MKIILLCEGKTEVALKPALKEFIDEACSASDRSPVGLKIRPFRGHPSCKEIGKRLDEYVRKEGNNLLAVVALLDVYPQFANALEAKDYLRNCVRESRNAKKFEAHAAQFEVEAWLLPYWDQIVARLNVQQQAPRGAPELVNGTNPPSKRLQELYKRGPKKIVYEKPIEAGRYLKDSAALRRAAEQCPELRSLLDTLTRLCGQSAA